MMKHLIGHGLHLYNYFLVLQNTSSSYTGSAVFTLGSDNLPIGGRDGDELLAIIMIPWLGNTNPLINLLILLLMF